MALRAPLRQASCGIWQYPIDEHAQHCYSDAMSEKSETRNQRVNLSLTPTEMQLLDALAHATGRTRGEEGHRLLVMQMNELAALLDGPATRAILKLGLAAMTAAGHPDAAEARAAVRRWRHRDQLTIADVMGEAAT